MIGPMKRALPLLTLILASCAYSPPAPQQQGRAAELAGRVAGAPQHCVTISTANSMRVSETDRHTLLYGSGRTIWANPLGPGCYVGTNDALVTEPHANSYCRGDIVRSFDTSSRIPGMSCVLGDFIPYTTPGR